MRSRAVHLLLLLRGGRRRRDSGYNHGGGLCWWWGWSGTLEKRRVHLRESVDGGGHRAHLSRSDTSSKHAEKVSGGVDGSRRHLHGENAVVLLLLLMVERLGLMKLVLLLLLLLLLCSMLLCKCLLLLHGKVRRVESKGSVESKGWIQIVDVVGGILWHRCPHPVVAVGIVVMLQMMRR